MLQVHEYCFGGRIPAEGLTKIDDFDAGMLFFVELKRGVGPLAMGLEAVDAYS